MSDYLTTPLTMLNYSITSTNGEQNMIILFILSCFNKTQPNHIHAQVEVIDSEIEIIFIKE